MHYVYILQSLVNPERFYTGLTADLRKRVAEHNSGKSIHTNKFKPWALRTYISFSDRSRADKFEKYLKSASGRAFMTKRF
jgi:putative endonuclease